MIQRITIDRLRGFNEFSLNDLGRVNLLVGTNNCGKTTVLESIQMLTSPGNLSPMFQILSHRGEDWYDQSDRTRARSLDIRRLFHGHELRLESSFSVEAQTEMGLKRFEAQIVESPHREESMPLFTTSPPSFEEADEAISRAALRVTWNRDSDLDYLIPMTRKGGLSRDSYRRLMARDNGNDSLFITTSSLSTEAVVALFESIVLTPEEELVVEALQIIEPSIERIATSGSDAGRGPYSDSSRGGVLVRCKNIGGRIPIGSMGDGIWRMLGLALALVRAEGGILLVDEIDTGLHFTVMEDMWRLIYDTARRLNVQVFATTHSRDCYESLATICTHANQHSSDITIQRIERNKIKSISYSEQEIIAAADRGMEVR